MASVTPAVVTPVTNLESTHQYECRVMQTLGIASIMRFDVKDFLDVIAPTMKETREQIKKAWLNADMQYALKFKIDHTEAEKKKDKPKMIQLLAAYKDAHKKRIAVRREEPSKLVRIMNVCYFDSENKPGAIQKTLVSRTLIDTLLNFLHAYPIEYVNFIFWYDHFSNSLFGATVAARIDANLKTNKVIKIEPVGTYGRNETLFYEKFYPATQGCVRYAQRQTLLSISDTNNNNSSSFANETLVNEIDPFSSDDKSHLVFLKYLWRIRIENGVFTPPILSSPPPPTPAAPDTTTVTSTTEPKPSEETPTTVVPTTTELPDATTTTTTSPSLSSLSISTLQRKNILVMPMPNVDNMRQFIAPITQNAINPLIDQIYFILDMNQVKIPETIRTFQSYFDLQSPQRLKFRFLVNKIETLADIQSEILRDQRSQITKISSDPLVIGATAKPITDTPAHKIKCNLLMAPLYCWFDESIQQIQHSDDDGDGDDASPQYVYALSARRYNVSDGKGRLFEIQAKTRVDAFVIPNFHRADYTIRFKNLALPDIEHKLKWTDRDGLLSPCIIENAGFVVRNPCLSVACYINTNFEEYAKITRLTENDVATDTILPLIDLSQM